MPGFLFAECGSLRLREVQKLIYFFSIVLFLSWKFSMPSLQKNIAQKNPTVTISRN